MRSPRILTLAAIGSAPVPSSTLAPTIRVAGPAAGAGVVSRDVEHAAPDVRFVSRAAVPLIPSFPKKMPIVALMTLTMLIFAVGAVVSRELLGSRALDAPATWAPAPIGTNELRELMTSVSGHIVAPPHGFGSEPLGSASRGGLRLAAATPVPAALKATDRYNFNSLVVRLSKTKVHDRGRRVLVTSVEKPADAADMAKGLGRMLSRDGRAILVSLDAGADEAATRPGVTDLVGGEASFSDIIERESGLRLHTVPVGRLPLAVLHKDSAAVDLALSAFDQTYDWVICVMRHSKEEALLSLFAPRVDAVVIASNADPASGSLVDLYEKAKTAGAPDVVVAREQASVAALEAA
jgi:hypothetical protein